jgi:hypothetical protein
MLNYLALLVLPFDLYDIELLATCIASAGELARKKLSLFPSISNMYKQLDKGSQPLRQHELSTKCGYYYKN